MPGGIGCYKTSNRMDGCHFSQPARPLRWTAFALFSGGFIAVALSGVQTSARQPQSPAAPRSTMSAAPQAVLDTYCITCHNQRLRTAGLALDRLDVTSPGADAEAWEK